MLESDVFDRESPEDDVVSNATYNLVIGLVLCWGFLINWLIVQHVNTAWLSDVEHWVFLVAYFSSCLFGVYLFNTSTDPAVSFIGYNFVVVPFGFVANLVVSQYEPNLVLQAVQITALVTIVMMILGVVFPELFETSYAGLVAALMLVLCIELFQHHVMHVDRHWTCWVVVGIFCGYIGYDWERANQIPKTVDNAVDSAAAIYMDVLNVFLRIIRLLGRKR